MVCGTYFLDQGLNPGPLHWEHGILATGPPGKSPLLKLKTEFKAFHRELPLAYKVMFKFLSMQYKVHRNLPLAVFTVYIPDMPFQAFVA